MERLGTVPVVKGHAMPEDLFVKKVGKKQINER